MRTPIDTGGYGEYLHYGMPLTLVTVVDANGRVNASTNASITPLPGSSSRLAIGILKENLTNQLIAASGEFVINVLTQDMRAVAKECGSRSGNDVDKLALCGLTTLPAQHVQAPLIAECPINIECRVESVQSLEDVDLWVARILAIEVASEWSDGRSGINLKLFRPLLYAFGHTFQRGAQVGTGGI